jgi:hypothetical protein
VEQCLGWDASAVKAGASELVSLDKRDTHAELGRAKCSGIATASAAEDYQVKVVISHCVFCSKNRRNS